MPHATPELRRLRIEAVVTTGEFAKLANYNRNAYSNVEHGHRVASPEAFQVFAEVLSQKLSDRRRHPVHIDARTLYASDDRARRPPGDLAAKDPDDDEHEHTDAGTGPPNRNDSTGPGRHNPDMRAAS